MTAQNKNKIIGIFGHGGNRFSKIINNSITMERVNESIYIKQISTELLPQIKEHISHLKQVDNAMREYDNKILMIPKEYFD
jgi:hypothetical protein